MTVKEFNDLLNRAHRDSAAFSHLYEFLLPKIVWYLGYKFGDNVDAYDVAHDFFSQMGEGKFGDIKIEYPLAWSYKTVFYIATKTLRKKERLTSLDKASEIRAETSDPATVIAVRNALEEIEEPQKTIIRLKGMYDVKFNEIAEILELNVSTVKTLYYRGLKALKDKLS